MANLNFGAYADKINSPGVRVVRRTKLEIILTVLNVCAHGASKTRIVYAANLNFRTANLYIDLLLKKGLLESKPSSRPSYMTTLQGTEVMKSLMQINMNLLQDLSPELDQAGQDSVATGGGA